MPPTGSLRGPLMGKRGDSGESLMKIPEAVLKREQNFGTPGDTGSYGISNIKEEAILHHCIQIKVILNLGRNSPQCGNSLFLAIPRYAQEQCNQRDHAAAWKQD